MKRNNRDLIILYLSGQMTEKESREFEAQLKQSKALQKELESCAKVLKEVKDLGSARINDQYFINLMPRVRERLEGKRRLRFYPKLAYILPVLAIIAILVLKPFSTGNNTGQNTTSIEFNNLVAGLDDNAKGEILTNLAENEDLTNPQPVHVSEAIDNETLEKKMNDELFKTDEARVNFLSNEDIESNLSQEETQKIYKAVLNKKIL